MTVNSNIVVRSTLFALAAVFAIANPAPADAAKMAPLEIGGWKGGVYSDNNTNRFSHCAVSAKYKNGITLLVSVTGDKNWSVGFANNDWNLSIGSKQPIRFKVDRGNSYNGTAVSRTKNLAQVKLPNSKRLFRKFTKGQKFYVKTRRNEFSFNLTDMREVMPTLVKCARHHAMADSDPFNSTSRNSDPFASKDDWETSQSKPARHSPTTQTRQEAFTAVSYMLGKAKLPAHYIEAADHQKLLAKNDVAWSMNGTVGTFRIIPDAEQGFENLRRNIVGTDKKSCAGHFKAKVIGDQSRSASRFMTGCDDVKNADSPLGMAVHYTLLPRREGGKYLISIIGKLDHSQKVRDLGNRLSNIAIALNANGSVPGARSTSY